MSEGAHTRAAADGQDNEPCLDFLQKGFETDLEADAPFTSKRRQFQEADVGNGQPVAVPARIVDGRSCVLGKVSLVKRQPDDNMGVEENHLSSPHSLSEIAGETISPNMVPLPARKL